ncbi:MAG: hypothetical protein HON90_00315, partial [Halobacteriovoraceae bacterium]|nr:hypothetical protein [Halobacteriovoraceae bacterium]
MKMLSYLFLSAVLFSSTSCLKQSGGQHIPGVNGPKVNIQDGKILLTVELEKVNLGAGLTVPLKNLPNSEVSISPGLMGGTIIRASFDLKDVENDRFKVVPPQLLPDGRAFPFTVDGTLPALAVNVP